MTTSDTNLYLIITTLFWSIIGMVTFLVVPLLLHIRFVFRRNLWLVITGPLLLAALVIAFEAGYLMQNGIGVSAPIVIASVALAVGMISLAKLTVNIIEAAKAAR